MTSNEFDSSSLRNVITNVMADSAAKTFIEHNPYLLRLRSDVVNFLSMLGLTTLQVNIEPFSPKVAQTLCTMEFPGNLNISAAVLESARTKLAGSIKFYESRISNFSLQAALSSCFISSVADVTNLPAKLNPFIRSFMNSIKFDRNEALQRRASLSMTRLISILLGGGKRAIVEKMLKNSKAFLLAHEKETPAYGEAGAAIVRDNQLFSVYRMEEEAAALEISLSMKRKNQKKSTESLSTDLIGNELDSLEMDENKTTKRGAISLFQSISSENCPDIWNKVPLLLSIITEGLFSSPEEDPNSVIESLELINVLLSYVAPMEIKILMETSIGQDSVFQRIIHCVQVQKSLVRFAASKCYSKLANIKEFTILTMEMLINVLLPSLEDPLKASERLGTTETLYHLCQNLDDQNLLPFVGFIIVPVMKRMSDVLHPIRYICSNTFSKLVQILPLESGCPDPPGLPQHLSKIRKSTRVRFLNQLLDRTRLDHFELPVSIGNDVKLRPYQQHGVDWLAFLNKFGLHGILVRVGKTVKHLFSTI